MYIHLILIKTREYQRDNLYSKRQTILTVDTRFLYMFFFYINIISFRIYTSQKYEVPYSDTSQARWIYWSYPRKIAWGKKKSFNLSERARKDRFYFYPISFTGMWKFWHGKPVFTFLYEFLTEFDTSLPHPDAQIIHEARVKIFLYK